MKDKSRKSDSHSMALVSSLNTGTAQGLEVLPQSLLHCLLIYQVENDTLVIPQTISSRDTSSPLPTLQAP